MRRFIASLSLVACLLAAPNLAQAAESDQVVGTWKLVSYVVEVKSTGEKMMVMGDNPSGYVMFNPEGRVFFVLTGDGRKPGKTDADKGETRSIITFVKAK